MQDNLKKYFKNKKVIITGHTGFKGTWLTLWLINLGANIVGISKDIHGSPSHYKDLKILIMRVEGKISEEVKMQLSQIGKKN